MLAVALGMAGSLLAQSSDVYKRNAFTGGYYHVSIPEDYIVEGSTQAVGLIRMDSASVKTVTGLLKIDVNGGSGISLKIYSSTGGFGYEGRRVLAIGGNHYQLGAYRGGTSFVKVNSTGAVIFAEYLNGKKCSAAAFNPVDMVYDGFQYIYATGSFDDGNNLTQTWVAKFNLSGTLQWIKSLHNNQYGNEPKNIYYDNDTCIYIGGIVQEGPIQNGMTTGQITRINSNGVVIQSKTISFFPIPNGIMANMANLNIKRNGSYLYIVAQPVMLPDGIGQLMIAKLDLNMNHVAHQVFDSNPFGFQFTPEFYFTPGASPRILVPGMANYYSSPGFHGYMNAFFDLNLNFLSGNNLGLNPNINGGNLSYPAPSTGHIFTLSQHAGSSIDFFYMKGAPGNDLTTCDTALTFNTEHDSLYLSAYPLVDSTMLNGTCNFTMAVNSNTIFPQAICYYCPACQREAQPTAAEGAIDGPVSVFPNPSNGHITMRFAFEQARDLEIRVMSLTGGLMYHASPQRIEKASLEYDLSSLPKGAYIVHITDDTGDRTVKKIMIE